MSGRSDQAHELESLRQSLERLKGQRDQIKADMKITGKNIALHEKRLKYAEEATVIIQTVAQQTQEELEYHLSEIVTLALAAVFEDPYELKVKFMARSGRTEVDILFLRDGYEVNPLDDAGGGPVDVATFALRLALWSMARPRSRNTIILDEPFKFLSPDLHPSAGAMLKLLSEKLKLQIVMVSHSEDLIEGADKVFYVRRKKVVDETKMKKISYVTEGIPKDGLVSIMGKESFKSKIRRTKIRRTT